MSESIHLTGADSIPPRVVMKGIVKRFGRVVANAGVDFDLRSGEIHALLGENGAGKTTLMQVLYGMMQPDSGDILLEGKAVRLLNPHAAKDAGIAMVHQHFKLVPNLTVAENVMLGDRNATMVGPRRLKAVARELGEMGDRHGLAVDPTAKVADLSVGEQQRTEILKALYRNAQVLILDEPTANLAAPEISKLLVQLREMASTGMALVIITHHLDEAIECADRITVLRHGTRVATLAPWETDTRKLARMMVGRDVATNGGERAKTPARSPEPATEVLAVQELHVARDRAEPAVGRVSFIVRSGEILAITGVEGNGQLELEEALTGLRRPTGGSVVLEGTEVTGATAGFLLRRGVGVIPADRYRRGLVRELSIEENLVLDRLDRPPFGTLWRLRAAEITAHAHSMIERYAIRAASPATHAGQLSGGQAQRVILARALRDDIRLLIASQPTRGLDIGATEFVWQRLRQLRDDGVAVLLLSSDLEEVLGLADRCCVMYRGRLSADFDEPYESRQRIGEAMGGLASGTAA